MKEHFHTFRYSIQVNFEAITWVATDELSARNFRNSLLFLLKLNFATSNKLRSLFMSSTILSIFHSISFFRPSLSLFLSNTTGMGNLTSTSFLISCKEKGKRLLGYGDFEFVTTFNRSTTIFLGTHSMFISRGSVLDDITSIDVLFELLTLTEFVNTCHGHHHYCELQLI